MKIVLIQSSHKLTPKHKQQIAAISKDSVVHQTTVDQRNFEFLLKRAEIILTQNLAVIDLNKTPNLKWIHLTSAGVNNLTQQLKDSDVIITNSSGVHPIPISEHVLGLMLMLVRNLHHSIANQLQSQWIRGGEESDELAGKTVAIIGLGQIGERVAKLCKAFEMKTIGVVRNPGKKRQHVDELFGSDKIGSALKNADFIINCLPETDETKHLFNKQLFQKFKKQSFFVNIGRGTTVNETHLLEALNNGQLKGAGLDVFEIEPLPKSSPLWKHPKVIITPHNSGMSPYYTDRMIMIFAENLKAFLLNKPLPNLIDKKLGY